MSSKIYGDLSVFGVIAVGSRIDISGSGYTLPYNIGNNKNVLGILPAPSSTGLTGDFVQWVDLSQGPYNFVSQSDLSAAISTSLSVGITGLNGIQVTNLGNNQFIIELYTPLSVSFASSPDILEIGQSVSAAILTWSYNKPAVISQSINQGIGSLPVSARNYVYSPVAPITANITFTINASDGISNANGSDSISFRRKRYWGTIPISGGMPSQSEILAGNQELSTNRNKVITYNCSIPSGGRYWYYTYPVSYGPASVTINNLVFNDWFNSSDPSQPYASPEVFSFTNIYNHTENYYMYRVFNSQFGASITVSYA